MTNKDIRRKRYATKRKTGCITCRVRRVKCDEAKPSCHRCTSTGRKCDGYIFTPSQVGKIQSLSFPTGGSDPENQAIYQFRTRISSLIASSFDIKFWTHDVLHNADAYTPVRHALAALASAYQKSILLGIKSASCDCFIFSQYEKAMRSLYTCFQGKALSAPQRLAALVANFLFTYTCSLQGLWQEALLHLRNGIALIHEWSDLRDNGQTTMIDILALYIRLDTQTRVISTNESVSILCEDPSLQLSFTKIEQKLSVCPAMRQLDIIHSQLLQTSFPLSPTSKLFYEQSLMVWDLRYQDLSATSNEQEKHITALRMRRIMVEVSFMLATNVKDSAMNNCIDVHCKAILDLALQLIRSLSLRPAQAGFYLANGLVEALYFVAVTSEDWDLRQQAIDTLRQYRFTDGVWESEAAADLAARRLQSDMNEYRRWLET
ncbi:Transcriptional regulatory protein moc3 [Fusarium austroafricanum]|uniref:Transcriptional regulatory protein moc3 n=1 Tax=Fusarium austroafricanum TaxID=2364996 RepID=A0A8H4K3T8_9HYPO|nr:Transcriptional regulatory protein moc3 [Fusarium austroafricanum]